MKHKDITMNGALSSKPSVVDPSAAKMAYFSRLSYNHDINEVKNAVAPFGYQVFQCRSLLKNAYIFADKKEIIVAHEGSKMQDMGAYGRNTNHLHYKHPLGNSVHAGFYHEIHASVISTNTKGLNKPLIEAVHEQICTLTASNPHAEIHFTGHSSGGVATILQAAHLIGNNPATAINRLKSIATFGQPRLGSPNFSKNLDDFMHKAGANYTRYVIKGDPIPELPPAYGNHAYIHSGTLKILSPPASSKKPYTSRNPFRNLLEYSKSRHSIGSYYQSCLESLKTHEEDFQLNNMTPEPSFYISISTNYQEFLNAFRKISDKEKIAHVADMLQPRILPETPASIKNDLETYQQRLSEILSQWTPRTEAVSLKQAGLICANFAKFTKWMPESYDELKNLGEFAHECSEDFLQKNKVLISR